MRTALIVNGIVNNVIEAPEGWTPPVGVTAVATETAGPGWIFSNGSLSAPATPQPTQAQLSEAVTNVCTAACLSIMSQVIPDQVHQSAYYNAAQIVGLSATVPTVDPAKTAFNNMASSFGYQPQQFATLVTAVAASSLTLSSILANLTSAVAAATSAAELSTALSAFETSIAAMVSSLNAAGLTPALNAPAQIKISGINA